MFPLVTEEVLSLKRFDCVDEATESCQVLLKQSCIGAGIGLTGGSVTTPTVKGRVRFIKYASVCFGHCVDEELWLYYGRGVASISPTRGALATP